LKKASVLIFDEATSNLDQPTAESFAQTINQLKGKVTMVFIAHILPHGLLVDEVVQFGPRAVAKTGEPQPPTQMHVVEDEKARP
jgi:ATP-binding cassette, subfamily B, bacterial HlyB/CyaB